MVAHVLGLETEYGMAALDENGLRTCRNPLAKLIECVGKRWPALSDGRSGLFLGNGARLYPELGAHPEYSTPECPDPWELVRQLHAGHRILELAAADVARVVPEVRELLLTRMNVDYVTRETWGCHESYLVHTSPLRVGPAILPHLVSRVVLTGAGGFDTASHGLRFMLSPRVAHLRRVVSGDSTHGRGILHTKDESLARGAYRRLHLICGESTCSHTSTFLKVGTTALVVALADAGIDPAPGIRLGNPLRAMQIFAHDPTGLLETRVGMRRRLSAVGLQRRCLETVEAHLDHTCMPSWAEEVCTIWRESLERVAAGPEVAATTLDWAIKWGLFTEAIRERGFSWERLRAWTVVLDRLASALGEHEDPDEFSPELIRDPTGPLRAEVEDATPWLEANGGTWDELDAVFDLRWELFALDVGFGRLGPDGLFERLEGLGAVRHRLVGADEIEAAVTSPPPWGRARLRGAAVRAFAERRQDFVASWTGVYHRDEDHVLDLGDPLGHTAAWTSTDDRPRRRRWPFHGA